MILFGITAPFGNPDRSRDDAIPKHRVRYPSVTNPSATNYPLDYSIG